MSFPNTDPSNQVAVEWLEFQVPRDRQAFFVEKDTEIWTPFLAQYPGFLNKEILVRDDRPNTLVIIIRWASREQWKAIPEKLLAETAKRFDRAVGEHYELVARECSVLCSYSGDRVSN